MRSTPILQLNSLRRASTLSGCLAALCIVFATSVGAVVPDTPGPVFGSPHLFFESNQGQFSNSVRYVARGPGYHVVIDDQGARFDLGRFDGKQEVRIVPVGGQSPHSIVASESLVGRVNYFVGNDSAHFVSDVPTFERVTLKDVYQGIDLVFRADDVRAEYDFVVAPRADPALIVVEFDGADSVSIDDAGRLVMQVGRNELVTAPPIAYQMVGLQRQSVEVAFLLKANGHFGFQVGEYDAGRSLIIDPVILEYSTSLGGSAIDDPTGLAVGSDGSIYVSGRTTSANFLGGPGSLFGLEDVFVSRISADGSSLIYTTFFGGSAPEFPLDLAVDGTGDAYVVTQTESTNLVIVNGFDGMLGGARDYAIVRLGGTGTVVYSTYYGGIDDDGAFDDGGIALAPNGNVYITGRTESLLAKDLMNSYQSTCTAQCAFVAGFDTSQVGASSLVYGSYVGGNEDDGGQDIGVDSSGVLYVFGFTSSDTGLVDVAQGFQPVTNDVLDQDNFLLKLDTSQSGSSQRVYSSYIGSPQGEAEPRGSLFVESAAEVLVCGATFGVADVVPPYAAGFPIKNAVQPAPGGNEDGYLVKIDTTTTGDPSLVVSTFLGGSGADSAHHVVSDSTGAIHLASGFGSVVAELPEFSAFTNVRLVQLDPTGQSVESAIPLPDAFRVAVDANDRVLVAGNTTASFAQVGPLPPSPVGGFEIFLARLESLSLSGSTLSVDSTTLVPGSGDDFAYVIELTNNGNDNLTDFLVTGDFPSGLSTLLTSLCFTGPGTITCQPADPSNFGGANALVPNERLTLFGRASSVATGAFDITSLSATTTPADPDPSDNVDGVGVTVVTTPPTFNALTIADFDASALSSDIGGFAIDTPRGVLATANGVMDDTANFMVFEGSIPVYVTDIYSRGRLAIGFVERTTWTPSSGDALSLLDIDSGFGTVDRVYASISLVGRGPVATVELRSGNASSSSVLVPGQQTQVGLDPNKAFTVTVDPIGETATVNYDGQLILSGNPFSSVLSGGADAVDVGDDMVISTGLGAVDLGGALFNDRAVDLDGDGLSDQIEAASCSDPLDNDSDDDGLSDGTEDADADGVLDPGETDPCNSDTDSDGIQDGTELGVTIGQIDPDGPLGPMSGTNLGLFVPDADPLTMTDATLSDTDGDGFSDGAEDLNANGRIDAGESDPDDPGSTPSVPVPSVGSVALGLIVVLSGALVSAYGLRRRH